MEKKYQDAVLTGLKCGAIIAGLDLICILVWLGLRLKSTPAYLIDILNVVSLAATVIGFPATGLYAIWSGKKQKNTTNYIVTIGSIAGIAAFVPFFIAIWVAYIWLSMAFGPTFSAFSPDIPIVELGVTLCCCLSAGIVLSAIVSAAGAWGYAYFTKGIK